MQIKWKETSESILSIGAVRLFPPRSPREIEAERKWQNSKDVNDNKRSGLLFAYHVESYMLYLYFPCYTFMHSLCVCVWYM